MSLSANIEGNDVSLNELTSEIIDCAMTVHSELGPGLLEKVYETCLVQELKSKGLKVKSQVPLPVIYKGKPLEAVYRVDLMVEEKIILEVKTVESIQPIHKAQLLTYLKLSNNCLGLLLNFNSVHLKDSIKRVIN